MKSKLTINEQICNLQDKGVTFNIIDIDSARKFLRYNSYYFKLKSYAHNYPINRLTGQYVNLDFAYLVELSKIDMYLRKYILNMCLEIEHILKTRLLYDVSTNTSEDGYQIVNEYFDTYPSTKIEIITKADTYSFTSDLAQKHSIDEEYAIWNVVELLSFGKFIELYTLYYQKYGGSNYATYLKSIKFLRNAAAHSNCLLSAILKPTGLKKFNKTKQLANALAAASGSISSHARDKYMANPIFHDFVALLFVYNDLMSTPANQKMRDTMMNDFIHFFCYEDGRVHLHKDYFKKNQTITEAFKFIYNLLKYIETQNNNPRHKRFLSI